MTTTGIYTPTIPTEEWVALSPFVHDVVAAVRDRVTYPEPVLFHTVTHHVHWAHFIAGFDLSRAPVFERDVIGYSVAMMPTNSPSTMGRTRSILLRVGESLGVIDVPAPLPPLKAADPSEPYSSTDVEDLRAWAYCQRGAQQQASAQALVALGLGCGLPTRDLARVRAMDADLTAATVSIAAGAFPRVVAVDPDWLEDLKEVAEQSARPHATLFRPGVVFHRNTVLTFVQRAMGAGLAPSTQRMRATWLVRRLAEGTPMQDLLFQAGVKSMNALVRYERFLPERSLPAAGGTGAPPGFP